MRKEIQKQVRAYVLDCVEFGLDNEELKTTEEKISYLRIRFESEYGWMIKQKGKYMACREWLLGLAIDVDFYYNDIEQRLKLWGVLEGDYSEKTLDKELDQYWDRLASAIIWMIERNKA